MEALMVTLGPILIQMLLQALPVLAPLATAGIKSAVAQLGLLLNDTSAKIPNELKPVINMVMAIGIAAAEKAAQDQSLDPASAGLALALGIGASKVRDAWDARRNPPVIEASSAPAPVQ